MILIAWISWLAQTVLSHNYSLTTEVTHDASTAGIFTTAEGRLAAGELVFFASDSRQYLMAYRFQSVLDQIAFKDRFNQQVCFGTTGKRCSPSLSHRSHADDPQHQLPLDCKRKISAKWIYRPETVLQKESFSRHIDHFRNS